MTIKWELEGNIKNGDNITLATGTKAHCKNAFCKLSEEEKQQQIEKHDITDDGGDMLFNFIEYDLYDYLTVRCG